VLFIVSVGYGHGDFMIQKELSIFKKFSIKDNIKNSTKKMIVGEFWTSKQRKANSLHEVSYRACFKPQLPAYFIKQLSNEGDIIFDPFSGRGTTVIEAALLGKVGISNDVNPISKVFIEARLFPPTIEEIYRRLNKIKFSENEKANIDLSMFYHKDTESEIVSLRNYLENRKISGKEDYVDKWIRMVATNRLSGHSKGFFSVYTFPPNQAVSRDEQIKINKKRNQIPEYRDVKHIILDKSKRLLKDVTPEIRETLLKIGPKVKLTEDNATNLKSIPNDTINLTVTSPPFLDVVSYAKDNWLRFWFNNISEEEVTKHITILKNINDWSAFISRVFDELYRITKNDGYVAFEVGEVRNGKIKLDEIVSEIGKNTGFNFLFTLVNKQNFTKTSNIWGVSNNKKGTNTNRIVLFKK
jgi:DNA methylase.